MSEDIQEKNEEGIIKESYNGLLIVKARNGNFNAGFDGNPRTLPDGTIFATDKALKYCIREYFATFKDEPVFVRRNRRIVKTIKKSNIGYGNQVEVLHGFGFQTKYAHLYKIIVKKGQRVKKGDVIGFVGSSGKSTGSHLHYEIKKNKKHINPLPFCFIDEKY